MTRSQHRDGPTGSASNAQLRIPGEQAYLQFAVRGVRSSVVRLTPTVHGPGDYGFIAMLISRRPQGRRGALHRRRREPLAVDPPVRCGNPFRLTLEKAPAGSCLHGADESGVTLRTIADLIGRKLDLPVA